MPILGASDTASVINNPLSLIYGLFNQASQPVADEQDWGVEAYFRRFLQDPSARCLVRHLEFLACLTHLLDNKVISELYKADLTQALFQWDTICEVQSLEALSHTLPIDGSQSVHLRRRPCLLCRFPF